MALLYADENFDHPVVAHLRSLGHDAQRIHQAIAALPSLVNQLMRIRKPAVASTPSSPP